MNSNHSPSIQHDYTVILLAKTITAHHIERVKAELEHAGLIVNQQQTETIERHGLLSVLRIDVTSSRSSPTELGIISLALADQYELDVFIQPQVQRNISHGLICFDMDSTLIGQEVIDELAKEAGIGEQVAEITERAMQGELDFQRSFRARVALLKGLDANVLAKIADRLTINEGAQHLITTLKEQGFHTAIFSGGFQYFAEFLQKKLGIDEVHANTLDIQNGVVTGEVVGQIVDAERKAELLNTLATRLNLTLEQTITVGDGANDLPMLSAAGIGVAYHAKPLVRSQAQYAISHVGLDGVLALVLNEF